MAFPKELQEALARRREKRPEFVGDPVAKIGVEMEGGWSSARLSKWVEWDPMSESWMFPLHEDLSLHREEYTDRLPHFGEMISDPMPPEEAIAWMHERYPDEVGARCGLHVHTSFTTTDAYVALMSRDFWKYFLQRWGKWYGDNATLVGAAFGERLNGNNRYCKRFFWPERQLLLKNKAIQNGRMLQEMDVYPPENDLQLRDPEPGHFRRTMLNYCWKMHKTIECRLFPMWPKPEVAELAIRELLDIYRKWLVDEHGQMKRKTIARRLDFSKRKRAAASVLPEYVVNFQQPMRRVRANQGIAPPPARVDRQQLNALRQAINAMDLGGPFAPGAGQLPRGR